MNRKLAAPLLSLTLASLLSLGCSTLRVSSDFDPEADFSSLSTYAWKSTAQPETGDPRLDNSLLDQRIRRSVDAELANRGFEKTESGQPTFLIGYHAAIEGKLDVQTINDYYGYGAGWGWNYGMGPGAGWRGSPETHVRQYDDGTLIIDVSDPATEKLIWRGSGQGELDENRTPEQRDAEVAETVGKILESFPPQKK